MLNELSRFLRQFQMVQPGDTVICALSGGADSVALTFGMYLLKEELGIRLEAAHFNHGLRGAESDGEEAFVREFCEGYKIPLHVGREAVVPGKKGLEAAAREARYRYFSTLDGKIATAHTADDNAETVLMHLTRGTGLKGLGGIAPVSGNLIRPMLSVTRKQVLEFAEEYCLHYCTDSSNETDDFLRNRLRHHVMPLLKQENPCFAENTSAMALRLRQDEQALGEAADFDELPDVVALRQLPKAVRSRMLERFLKENGVKEPEAAHISLAESLVFSEKPSAQGHFPGGITICRNYDRLEKKEDIPALQTMPLSMGVTQIPGYRITCTQAQTIENTPNVFTVAAQGGLFLRCRQPSDAIRLSGGTKILKKAMIDRKIPAGQRLQIPVICDEAGILAVAEIGVNLDRKAEKLPAVRICIEKLER